MYDADVMQSSHCIFVDFACFKVHKFYRNLKKVFVEHINVYQRVNKKHFTTQLWYITSKFYL